MSNVRKMVSVVRSMTFREVIRDIDASASEYNRFGHKCLAVCYGLILGQVVVSFYI